MVARVKPPRLAEPSRYRSSGKWYTPQMYVVGWPDGIVKVGSTENGRRRWGKFLNRGAVMLDLAYFAGCGDIETEVWLQEQVKAKYPRAFQHKSESLPYLGDGCGYLECFRVPVNDWPALIELARS